MEPKFKIGDEVVRVSGQWNLMMPGDTSVVDGVKPYNRGFSVHLRRDKPETFHSESGLELVSNTDMGKLMEKLSKLKSNKEEAIVKRKQTKNDKLSKD